MDHRVPNNPFEAVGGTAADSGVDPLLKLVADLHAQGYETDDIGLVAHSYGSSVAGHAMQEGLDVGRVVVVGSPGMATGADNRADLGSPNVALRRLERLRVAGSRTRRRPPRQDGLRS